MHAELTLGLGHQVNVKRVVRLMRQAGIQGISRRPRHGCTRRRTGAVPSDNLVHRQFRPDGPDRLWVADVTQHPTGEGWVYLATVIDAWSRRVVGWSIADHLRAELVVDALDMATMRRRPSGTVMHSDHWLNLVSTRRGCSGSGYVGPGCSGRWAPSATPSTTPVAASFFASLQCELLDRQHWATRVELAQAMFHWIEGLLQSDPPPLDLDYRSPVDFERLHTAAITAA